MCSCKSMGSPGTTALGAHLEISDFFREPSPASDRDLKRRTVDGEARKPRVLQVHLRRLPCVGLGAKTTSPERPVPKCPHDLEIGGIMLHLHPELLGQQEKHIKCICKLRNVSYAECRGVIDRNTARRVEATEKNTLKRSKTI